MSATQMKKNPQRLNDTGWKVLDDGEEVSYLSADAVHAVSSHIVSLLLFMGFVLILITTEFYTFTFLLQRRKSVLAGLPMFWSWKIMTSCGHAL